MNIFVLSDSTGESANASVKTAAAQFEYCSGSTCATSRATVYRFVRSSAEIKSIIEAAKKCNALLVGNLRFLKAAGGCEFENLNGVALYRLHL